MIKQLIELLNMNDWYGVSENVDIAKGKYKALSSYSEITPILKRHIYGKGDIN